MAQESNSDQQFQINQPVKEGVIQYQLRYHLDHNSQCEILAELNSWRSYLHRLGLIGQDSARYDGLGYGNISHRLQFGQNRFIISGTQTGHLPLLCREHYVTVEQADVSTNTIDAHGPIKPSSEALTHGALYQAHGRIQAVIHVHSPLLWHQVEALDLPFTAAHIPYGTKAMADAVCCCVNESVKQNRNLNGLIAMLGHEDGIVAYGSSLREAGEALLDALVRANHHCHGDQHSSQHKVPFPRYPLGH